MAAARSAHLNAQGAAAHAAYAASPVAAPVAAHGYALGAPAVHGYAATPAVPAAAPAPAHYGLVSHPNGAVVPQDEPAVVQARAAHFSALAAVGH